jgi:hypothetical protein
LPKAPANSTPTSEGLWSGEPEDDAPCDDGVTDL